MGVVSVLGRPPRSVLLGYTQAAKLLVDPVPIPPQALQKGCFPLLSVVPALRTECKLTQCDRLKSGPEAGLWFPPRLAARGRLYVHQRKPENKLKRAQILKQVPLSEPTPAGKLSPSPFRSHSRRSRERRWEVSPVSTQVSRLGGRACAHPWTPPSSGPWSKVPRVPHPPRLGGHFSVGEGLLTAPWPLLAAPPWQRPRRPPRPGMLAYVSCSMSCGLFGPSLFPLEFIRRCFSSLRHRLYSELQLRKLDEPASATLGLVLPRGPSRSGTPQSPMGSHLQRPERPNPGLSRPHLSWPREKKVQEGATGEDQPVGQTQGHEDPHPLPCICSTCTRQVSCDLPPPRTPPSPAAQAPTCPPFKAPGMGRVPDSRAPTQGSHLMGTDMDSCWDCRAETPPESCWTCQVLHASTTGPPWGLGCRLLFRSGLDGRQTVNSELIFLGSLCVSSRGRGLHEAVLREARQFSAVSLEGPRWAAEGRGDPQGPGCGRLCRGRPAPPQRRLGEP